MYLSQLLQGIYNRPLPQDPFISGLCHDSRLLKPGELFFAYSGREFNVNDFLKEALEKGASAILIDSKEVADPSFSIPFISIFPLTAYMGLIAARFYAHPSQHIPVIGVTGTNGKTSCTHFLAQALQYLHCSSAVIGTLGNGLWNHLKPSLLTTPDAIELQQLVAEFHEKQAQAVFMEVSSHRLAQHRLNGMEFAMAAFTNLTRDHLDYHETMERYARAKQTLFLLPGVQQAILNADDRYAQGWIRELAYQLPLITYTLQRKRYSLKVPQISVQHYKCNEQGIQAYVTTPWGDVVIENQFLLGDFNLRNLLLVLSVLKGLGFPLSDIARALSRLKGIKGRMEAFHAPARPLVIIDYAHTPDALQHVLKTLRRYSQGLLYCVFGCGGNRDKGKRALMGQIAEQLADHLVLTNDNPRFEDPEQIISDIQRGLSAEKPVYIELDRRLAITYAIEKATPKDIVLLAGKGHETYQLIKGTKYPFSDAKEVERLLFDKV